MKKFFYMAVAAIAALSSCSSDDAIVGEGGQHKGNEVSTFTATIEGNFTTRTTVNTTSGEDYGKVSWSNGDAITINGVEYTTTSTTETGTFTTTAETPASAIEGKYKAIYPASMASVTGSNVTFSLPASYTYEAGKFNMPSYAESDDTQLSFKNICGVLAITLPSEITKVSSITVSSDKQLNGAFTADANGVLTFDSKKLVAADKKVTLNVETGGTDNIYYLPVPAGDHTLTIAVIDDSTIKHMTTSAAVTIARNKIYNISFSAKHTKAYVKIGGLRWATMNVGATTVAGCPNTSYGDYYAWGATEPHYSGRKISDNGLTMTFTSWKKEGGYIWQNAPLCAGTTSFSNFKDSEWSSIKDQVIDENWNILPAYDVATKKWGTVWRMPTQKEFQSLYEACGGTGTGLYKYEEEEKKNDEFKLPDGDTSTTAKGIYWCKDYDGVKGVLFSDGTNKVFFPAAGYCDDTRFFPEFQSDVPRGIYWSATTLESWNGYHRILGISSKYIYTNNLMYRYYGHVVRPVSDY